MARVIPFKFKPRDYQKPVIDAIINKGYKKVLAIWPRRAGKDLTAFNICIHECLKQPQVIFYVFPTYAHGRKILWDSLTSDGTRLLDYIPEEFVESRNEQMMRIRFVNGSLFQVIGSDSYDTSLVGTNPSGIVYSEWALQDERAYQYARPILAHNKGWALFLSTPRGKNHMWTMYQYAKDSTEWYVQKLTIDDTKHIDAKELESERQELSEAMIMQEYYSSFSMGVEGAYWAKYIDKMRLNAQITDVNWDPVLKTHTAFDIGVRDSTTIIFFQCTAQSIRIIDCYEAQKEGLEHYVSVVKNKPYEPYGKHIAPHDIRVREFGSGITRWEKARQLGITFTMANNVPVADGIEAVRSMLPKTWIDQRRCGPLIKSLENYRQEYDAKKKVYNPRPLHDWSSHFADAMRYLAVSLPKTRDSMTQEDFDEMKARALYGNDTNLPPIFQDRYKNYTTGNYGK